MVDLTEISILITLLFQKTIKSVPKLPCIITKTKFSKIDPLVQPSPPLSPPSHPHQHLDLSLKFHVQVPIPQHLPSQPKKCQKFHLTPIFPGSLTRSQQEWLRDTGGVTILVSRLPAISSMLSILAPKWVPNA